MKPFNTVRGAYSQPHHLGGTAPKRVFKWFSICDQFKNIVLPQPFSCYCAVFMWCCYGCYYFTDFFFRSCPEGSKKQTWPMRAPVQLHEFSLHFYVSPPLRVASRTSRLLADIFHHQQQRRLLTGRWRGTRKENILTEPPRYHGNLRHTIGVHKLSPTIRA